MKPISNIPLPKITLLPIRDEVSNDYRCRFCGEDNSGIVTYTETQYGEAHVDSLDGDYSDFEMYDTDNFESNGFRCGNCGREGHSLAALFVPASEYCEPVEDEDE
jgi:hypothetical protein